MARSKRTPTDRFWAKVRKETSPVREGLTPCWTWTGGTTKNGYGQFCWPLRGSRAHRLSWFMRFGDVPQGLLVLHRCDNRPCVNPEHLFLGTHQDNQDDMWAKGRGWSKNGHHSNPADYRTETKKTYNIGEDHPNAKLNSGQVLEIRHDHEVNGTRYSVLAKQYHVDRASIRDVILRRSWTHI